jgi:hypothetical protein
MDKQEETKPAGRINLQFYGRPHLHVPTSHERAVCAPQNLREPQETSTALSITGKLFIHQLFSACWKEKVRILWTFPV